MTAHLLLTLLPSLALAASPTWEDGPPMQGDPSELLATAAAFGDGDAAVEILLLRTDIEVHEDGRRTTVVWSVRQLNDVAAAGGSANIQTSWTPWFEDQPDVQARVILPDGRIVGFDPVTFQEVPVKAGTDPLIFSDDRSLRAPLPQLSNGALVEQVHRWTEHTPFSTAGVDVSESFQSYESLPIRRTYLRVSAPKQVPLNVHTSADAPVPSKGVANGRRWIAFDADPPALRQSWPDRIPVEQVPWAAVWISTVPSWAALVRSYEALISPQLDPAGLEDLVTDVKAADTPREAVRRALRGVQDRIRYTGAEFGVHAIVPYRPGVCVQRGYGDCKDQSAALVAVLRAAGHEAHLALLAADNGAEAPAEAVSLRRFNHAIVQVRLPEGPLWIDPTAPHLALGDLPRPCQNRLALVIALGTEALTQTPAIPARYSELRQIDLTRPGVASLDERTSMAGWSTHNLRRDYLGASEAEIAKWLGDYLSKGYDATGEVAWSMPDRSRDQEALAMSIGNGQVGLGYSDLLSATVRAWPSPLFGGLEVLTDGDLDGAIEATTDAADPPRVRLLPQHTKITWRVVTPPGWELTKVPEDLAVEVGPVKVTRTLTTAPDQLDLGWELTVSDTSISLLDARDLRDALNAGGYRERVVLEVKPRWYGLDTAGQALAAVQAAREALGRAPNDPLTRSAWSELLGRLGMVEASVEQAEATVDLAPNAPEAVRALLYARVRDPDGAWFSGEFDRASARETALLAVQLLPDDAQVLEVALGVLRRPAPTESDSVADQQRALELAEAWLADHKDDAKIRTQRDELLISLDLWDRVERRPAADASANVWGRALAAALVVGSAQEPEQLFRRIPVSVRPEAYALAAKLLLTEGVAAPIVTLMQWGTTWSPPSAQTTRAIDLLQQATAWRRQVAPKDPQWTLFGALETASSGEELRPDVFDFTGVAPHLHEALTDLFARTAGTHNDMPARLAVELVVPHFTIAEQIGADARLVRLAIEGSTPVHWAMVKRKGSWRVRAVSDFGCPAGLEAREALRRGDEATARTWVKWAEQMLADGELRDLRGAAVRWADAVPDSHTAELEWPISLLEATCGVPGALDALSARVEAIDPHLRNQLMPFLAHVSASSGTVDDQARLQRLYASEHFPRDERASAVWRLRRVDAEAGLALMRQLAASAPDDLDLRSQLASMLTNENHHEEADKVWSTIERIETEDRNNRSWNLLCLRRFDEAVQVMELAGRLDDMDLFDLHTLAMAYLLSGRVDRAQAVFNKARLASGALSASWASVRGGLALAYGLPDHAQRYLAQVPEDQSDERQLAAWLLPESSP
jgi:transglutaminase-like putative cysteine protease/tetratricopeptide (TPR) repeat protein